MKTTQKRINIEKLDEASLEEELKTLEWEKFEIDRRAALVQVQLETLHTIPNRPPSYSSCYSTGSSSE